MDCIVHPTYFPNIAHFTVMQKADTVCFEMYDNYQKQTYRNRMDIYSSNGKLSLTVPVIFSQKKRQLYKDVKIYNTDRWQNQHLKSLFAAYNTSPFFEFYIDELLPIFETSFNYIFDLNLKCFEILKSVLQVDIKLDYSSEFEKSPVEFEDYRKLVKPNDNSISLLPYTQVFVSKHGFIPNLSILDLLFNEGPSCEIYLNKQEII